MRAYLIDAVNKSIEQTEISSLDDIKQQVGYDTIESDSTGDAVDRLFFDEECFIRGSEGRFQIDNLIPVAGKGIIVGGNKDGSELSDVHVSQADLEKRIKFI